MNDLSRLQVRKNDTEHAWGDVGNKASDEHIPVDVKSIEALDIEIGAVELKDGTTDQRAVVNGFGYLMVDGSGTTQPVTGSVSVTTIDPTMVRGADVAVGTTPVELTFTGTTKSISIKAASTNTGIIYVGTSTVLSDGTNAFGELTADSSLSFDYNDGDLAIYVVASIAAQKVYKMTVES